MANKTKAEETKAVTPWKPFMGLTRWETEMERLFNDFFGRKLGPSWPERWVGAEMTTPALDVYEDKDDIVVKAELPGLGKDDIQVNISDSELTLKGEKKKEEKIEEEDYYRGERSYGAFTRSVDLPADVQADKVKASFKDGILEVRLPKTEEAKTKAKPIKIKVD
jgi:HSP20 family protein